MNDSSNNAALSVEATMPVVCIGASAGGLAPIEEFFASMPPDTGASFVLVQHLSPKFKSLMDELLRRQTKMAIRRAEHGMRLEADTIYLIPPGKGLLIEAGALVVEDRDVTPDQPPFLPINDFLVSLADDVGDRAVAVILSGSGSDGAVGARAVAEAGGSVLVQTPDSAQFDGMLLSAIATNTADAVLPPAELAEAVAKYIEERRRGVDDPQWLDGTDEGVVRRILELMLEEEQVDFHQYKAGTLRRRISGRAQLLGAGGLDSYFERLVSDPEERAALRSAMLIGVTRFFRDRDAWTDLRTHVLPKLLDSLPTGQQVRVWSAGCSTGEEAVSVAIAVSEALAEEGIGRSFKVFATDLDPAAIDFAAAGRYPIGVVNELDPTLIERYFVEREDHYEIGRDLRRHIVFARHDLTRDTPFTRIHLVICRNLLIYLLPERQAHVLRLLHFACVEGGVLFLGSAEGLGPLEPAMRTLSAHHKLYVKTAGAPLGPRTQGEWPLRWRARRTADRAARGGAVDPTPRMRGEVLDAFVTSHGACAFVVSQDGTLLDSVGELARVVRVQPGPYRGEFVRMLPESLVMPVSTAMHRSRRESMTVRFDNVAQTDDEPTSRWNVTATFFRANSHRAGFHAVLLEPVESAEVAFDADDGTYDPDVEAAQRIRQLETELGQARESLQTTVEELETTNEEQQATNEELLSANEELQSTNEELHSVNEELYTVNAEYQVKIQQLTELTDDFDNMLRSTDLGVLFLDEELRIRRFTPAMRRVLNVQDGDAGRPLSDITHRATGVDLVELAERVSATRRPVQREIVVGDSDHLLLRVHPYEVEQRASDGVVITVVDTSEIKAIEQALRESEARFRELATHVREVFWVASADGSRVEYVSPAFETVFRAERDALDLCVVPPWLGLVEEDEREAVAAHFRASLDDDRPYDARYAIRTPDGRRCVIRDRGYPVRDGRGHLERVVGIADDVTEFREALATAERAAARFEALVDAMPDVVYERTLPGTRMVWRGRVSMLMGPASEETGADEWYARIDDAFRADVIDAVERTLDEGVPLDVTYRTRLPLGHRWLHERGTLRRASGGTPAALVGIVRDITPTRTATERLAEHEAHVALALEGGRMGTWSWDPDADVFTADDHALAAVGMGSDGDNGAVFARALREAKLPDRRAASVPELLARAAEGADMFEATVILRRRRPRFVELRGRAAVDPTTGARRVHGVVWDVTAEREIERRLALSETRLRQIIDLVPDSIVALDDARRVKLINQAAAERFGQAPDAIQGVAYGDLLPDGVHNDWVVDGTERVLRDREPVVIEDAAYVDGQGHRRSLRARHIELAEPETPGQEGRAVLSIGIDLTEERRAVSALRYRAFYDPLTGLPNRDLFVDRLHQACARRDRDPERRIAVLFMDLDGFKDVNDSLGHLVGDELLMGVADRLIRCVRPGDSVARFGGDEFAMLLEGVRDAGEVLAIASRVHEAMAPSIGLEGHKVHVTASIGIASVRAGQSVEDVLRDADVAMYQAKRTGPGRTRIFDQTMREAAHAFLELKQALLEAVDAGDFDVHFQPIEDAERNVVCYEALVRWLKSDGDTVSPGAFLGVAERAGILVDIEGRVLRLVLDRLREWQQASPDPSLRVAVNVTDRLLRDARFELYVVELEEQPELARLLVFELNESAMIAQADATASVLHRLRALGAKIALDDFGTGLSSLSHLANMPIDILKVDGSFVSGAVTRRKTRHILASTVTLAHGLGMTVVAEGIEDEEQYALARELGCDWLQGYHLARPAAIPGQPGESTD